MIDPTPFNEQMRSAMIDAVESLTTLFWGPTPEACQEMIDGTFWDPFEALAPFLTIDPPDTLVQLKQIVSTHQTGTHLAEQLEELYVDAFVTRRGGIRASLYASSYHGDDTTLMDEPVRLMQARLTAKGLKLAAERNEPADHLAIQLEFCFFLLTQEDRVESRREAASFVDEALLQWVPQFCTKLCNEDPSGFYPLTASLLLATLILISELG